MALTSEEQELLDFALAALPPWFSDAEGRDFAVEGGMAKMAGAARAQVDYWFSQTLISEAVGPTSTTPDWLGQHARDRGTRRQDGEVDDDLRRRLRTFEDALTVSSIMDAAQAALDEAGVTGDLAMVELRRDRGFFVVNQAMTGTGGTFVAQAGNLHSFVPDVDWPRPPIGGLRQNITWKLVISGADSAGNDGTFEITDLDGDRAVYTNASGVAEVDAGVAWRVDRYDAEDNILTEGSGRLDAYMSRGFRMGSQYGTIILILPYGTSAATAASVAEAVRLKKAAGVRVIVERRLNP